MSKRIIAFFLAAAALCVFPVRFPAQEKAGKEPSHAKCAHCQKEKFVSVQAKNGAGKPVPLCYECAMLPRCEYCQLPSETVSGGGDRLCRDCAKDCIKENAEAEKVLKDVRQV
ncbi:MAG: hypothetical protein IKO02_03570, partial [Lentisphaeria bacterium]|nr:hypothetical protein [Lentisphaeria bacterium]